MPEFESEYLTETKLLESLQSIELYYFTELRIRKNEGLSCLILLPCGYQTEVAFEIDNEHNKVLVISEWGLIPSVVFMTIQHKFPRSAQGHLRLENKRLFYTISFDLFHQETTLRDALEQAIWGQRQIANFLFLELAGYSPDLAYSPKEGQKKRIRTIKKTGQQRPPKVRRFYSRPSRGPSGEII